MYNPSLREQPRHQPAQVIPLQQNASILGWLESTGRLLDRDAQSFDYLENEAEISDLMGVEEDSYDLDEGSDDMDADDV